MEKALWAVSTIKRHLHAGHMNCWTLIRDELTPRCSCPRCKRVHLYARTGVNWNAGQLWILPWMLSPDFWLLEWQQPAQGAPFFRPRRIWMENKRQRATRVHGSGIHQRIYVIVNAFELDTICIQRCNPDAFAFSSNAKRAADEQT